MNLKGTVFRSLVFTHRYLGMGIGLLMLLWCVSGVVMMYVPFPELDRAAVDKSLTPLTTSRCCKAAFRDLSDEIPIQAFSMEMLNDQPTALIELYGGSRLLVNATSGEAITSIGAATALRTAKQYASAHTVPNPFRPMAEQLNVDQWTVYDSYSNDRPLQHVTLNDRDGTELYVSNSSGRIVLATTRMERFWNWVGSIPHWLYFTKLRQHTQLWSQIIIWSSIVGAFLTGFGMWLGFWQLRRKSNGELASPYRGLKWLHHVPGLLFGVLVMTWVLSGLFSMTPWGFLESEGMEADAYALQGDPPDWKALREALEKVNMQQLPANTVRLDMALYHGVPYFITTTKDGQRQRLNSQWQPAPLTATDFTAVTHSLTASDSAQWQQLNEEDLYYYSHDRDNVTLPVILITRSHDPVRFYVDPISGELLKKIDANTRGYRWLHYGLHRMDFPGLRLRPLWDVVMWVMLLGVTAVCATGAWMGFKRLLRI